MLTSLVPINYNKIQFKIHLGFSHSVRTCALKVTIVIHSILTTVNVLTISWFSFLTVFQKVTKTFKAKLIYAAIKSQSVEKWHENICLLGVKKKKKR